MIFGGKNWMFGVKWSQKEIALRAWEIKADSLFAVRTFNFVDTAPARQSLQAIFALA